MEGASSVGNGLLVRVANHIAVDTPRNLGLAPICYQPLANIPGHAAAEQGKEILSRKFASLSECSLLCTEHADQSCNSFTLCSGWDMCFLKDKILAEDEKTVDRLPGDCMSFRAVPCMLEIGMQTATVMMQPPPVMVRSNRMIFYMYHAQSDDEYPMENMNMADLAGLMWYLHSEVLQEQPRNWGLTRILRYKVAVKNPEGFFGKFMAYEGGRCITEGCSDHYEEKGFEVGCEPLDAKSRLEGNYVRDFVELAVPRQVQKPLLLSDRRRLEATGEAPHNASENAQAPRRLGFQNSRRPAPNNVDATGVRSDGLHGGLWFSLPRGGSCNFPSGERDCTYSFEPAGEVSLDELTGIIDPEEGINSYEDFWKNYYPACQAKVEAGTREKACVKPVEYDFDTDRGTHCSFWDKRLHLLDCQVRMEKVRALFHKNHPDYPKDLGTPSPEMCPS